jgi:hypothetical protein
MPVPFHPAIFSLTTYSGCQKNVPIAEHFFATTLMPPSFFRNINMTSGINRRLQMPGCFFEYAPGTGYTFYFGQDFKFQPSWFQDYKAWYYVWRSGFWRLACSH